MALWGKMDWEKACIIEDENVKCMMALFLIIAFMFTVDYKFRVFKTLTTLHFQLFRKDSFLLSFHFFSSVATAPGCFISRTTTT